MDLAHRERVIQLGALITSLRRDIAELSAKLEIAEAELDHLFEGNEHPPKASPDDIGTPGIFETLMRVPSVTGVSENGSQPVPPVLLVHLPPDLGTFTLNDQVLALIKANEERSFTPEQITNLLNNNKIRTEPARLESVYAALSRLVSDQAITRVERGLYRAAP
jgi:hypothetical protein